MSSPGDVKLLSREDLLAVVAELQRQVTALQKQVAELAASNQELRAEMDRMTRQGHRQATPFSKGTRAKQPRHPGRKLRGAHPDLAPDQYGATAHRLGPRAMAAAHALHYQVGIPVRKVPLVLATLKGLTLTQGAITQACPEHSRRDALRRSHGRVGQVYQALRNGVRDSRVVYTNDTGWKVGGENAHLMAFDTDEATVTRCDPDTGTRRRRRWSP